jgi:acyl carrier protein
LAEQCYFPQAFPPRTEAQLRQLHSIDARFLDLACAHGAEQTAYPALISWDVLHRAEYHQAFPHLLMTAGRVEPHGFAADGSSGKPSISSGWCLSPAVCYHTYGAMAGQTLFRPRIISACGTCFRNETSVADGIRQIEFQMREIVLVGHAEWVRETSVAIQEGVEAIARDVGITGAWNVAEDPFFLPASRGKALLQRLKQLKREYQLDAAHLAVASVNQHETFFGERFDIRNPDGTPAHTACIAMGLDRWLTASSDVDQIAGHSLSERRKECLAQLVERLPFLSPSLPLDSRIADLRLDSLDLVELLCVVDEVFRVRVSQEQIESAYYVYDLLDVICENQSNQVPQ